MSENITHTAVTDDCARLALYSGRVCSAFKMVLDEHLEIARLGGVTRSGGKFVVPLLRRFGEGWSRRQEGDYVEQKLAFVLGWLCHRAADLQMKPVFHAADPDCAESPTDCSVYHDVFLFREVYRGGEVEPYAPDTLDAGVGGSVGGKAFDVREIESALRSFWQRALLGLHTFIPDQSDIEGWLERLFRTRQEFYVDIRRYAEAYANPDPDKVKRFIVDVNFYRRDDLVIRLARSLQHGRAEATIKLQEAVATDPSQSEYAQALQRGYGYIEAASSFFEGKMDEETFRDRLERGLQGVS